jgi:hypothetical protein
MSGLFIVPQREALAQLAAGKLKSLIGFDEAELDDTWATGGSAVFAVCMWATRLQCPSESVSKSRPSKRI